MNREILDFTPLQEAHARALAAVSDAIPGVTQAQADELTTALVALVFETLKQYLPGEDKCN